MPELPEVETIRRRLAPAVEGRVIAALAIDDARWCEPLTPRRFVRSVAGRRIERLSRRGKYLVWELEGEVYMIMHLRMTGTLLVDPPEGTPYVRVRIDLDDGRKVRFCDPRRFGTGQLALSEAERDEFFAARLGIEPLDGELTGRTLRSLTRGRRAPIKAFLLDQRRIAGVGNIYADEALHAAGIHPERPAGSLTTGQCEALAEAVRDALLRGIDAGGATIDDFRHPDGVSGAFQHQFQVYGRRGETCGTCGAEIVKLVVAGRGTYVCETCQPRPRRRRKAAARAA